MSIKDITGNETAKKELLSIVKNKRKGNSFLFAGEENTGKRFAAIQFAKSLNCLSPQKDNDACDKCESCKLIDKVFMDLDEKGNQKHLHQDLLYINTEKMVLGIDLIRENISKINSYGIYKLKKKIVIINDAEKMEKEAANSILKELEEPALNVIIILIVNNIDKILPTILSRTYRINIKRASMNDIIQTLEKLNLTWNKEKIKEAALFSDGKIGVALDYDKIKENIEIVKNVFLTISDKQDNVEEIFNFINFIEKKYKEKQTMEKKKKVSGAARIFLLDILKLLSYIYKDLLVFKINTKILNFTEKYKFKNFDINNYNIKKIIQIIKIIENAQKDIGFNANISLLLNELFFNIRKIRSGQ